jgi:hypothetical protein
MHVGRSLYTFAFLLLSSISALSDFEAESSDKDPTKFARSLSLEPADIIGANFFFGDVCREDEEAVLVFRNGSVSVGFMDKGGQSIVSSDGIMFDLGHLHCRITIQIRRFDRAATFELQPPGRRRWRE